MAGARGRAVGLIVAAATQRPSSDIIPTSLRDLFAWRFAGRTSTDSSSDIVLGSETAGLTAEAQPWIHDRVSIPMANGVESLNVAAAAAVVAFELLRARRR